MNDSNDYKDSYEYELQTPFEYMYGGEGMIAASNVLMKSPTAAHLAYTSKLRQGFFQAIGSLESGGSESKDQDGKISGDEIVSVILMSSIDATKYIDTFKQFMIKSNLFLIDGETPIKDGILKDLSEEDFMGIMGAYLENFLISSWMKKLTES